MSMKQLRIIHTIASYATILASLFFLIVFTIWMFVKEQDHLFILAAFLSLALVLLCAVSVTSLVIVFFVGLLMSKKLVYLLNQQLDPDAALQELGEFRKLIGNMEKLTQYYMSFVYDLQGKYSDALAIQQDQKMPKRPVSGLNRLNQAYFMLRCGLKQDALPIVRQYEPAVEKGRGEAILSHVHTIGLYYLESGDMDKALGLLNRAFASPVPIVKLNCAFDLARLYLQSGDTEQAMSYFRQAAELGPKTWLGQEAARRFAALQRIEPRITDGEAAP